jgi:hypothetical protein
MSAAPVASAVRISPPALVEAFDATQMILLVGPMTTRRLGRGRKLRRPVRWSSFVARTARYSGPGRGIASAISGACAAKGSRRRLGWRLPDRRQRGCWIVPAGPTGTRRPFSCSGTRLISWSATHHPGWGHFRDEPGGQPGHFFHGPPPERGFSASRLWRDPLGEAEATRYQPGMTRAAILRIMGPAGAV